MSSLPLSPGAKSFLDSLTDNTPDHRRFEFGVSWVLSVERRLSSLEKRLDSEDGPTLDDVLKREEAENAVGMLLSQQQDQEKPK